MQNREDPFAATTATPFAEIFAKMPNVVEEEADDGLRLITAFLRILVILRFAPLQSTSFLN